MSAEARLKLLNITLPEVQAVRGNYVPALLHGNTLYLSGQVPYLESGEIAKGIVGKNVSVEDAAAHAKRACLMMLANIRQALGSLDRVEQVLHIVGAVGATPDFVDHAKVINGCSDFLVEVFGEAGKHTRFSFGASSLPVGMIVEISAVIAVKD